MYHAAIFVSVGKYRKLKKMVCIIKYDSEDVHRKTSDDFNTKSPMRGMRSVAVGKHN